MGQEAPDLLCRTDPELVCLDNSPTMSINARRDPIDTDRESFDYLRGALEDLVATAQNFAAVCINDAGVRANYVRKIRSMADDVMMEVRAGRTTVEDGAEFAQNMRNLIMGESRRRLSAIALAFSEAKKLTGKTLATLIEEHVQDLFPGKQFIELATAERRQVFEAVIESAGHSSAVYTGMIPTLRLAGRGCALFTIGIVVYDIWTAQNKVEAGLNDALVFGGGAVGGALAGAATGLLCGPAAPFCSTALFVVGGIMGTMAGQVVSTHYSAQLHELASWLGDL